MRSLFIALSILSTSVFASTSMTISLDPVKGEVGKLNTIFVIDNSGSMTEYQQQVVKTIGAYFSKMTTMTDDYSIAVMSTDESERLYGVVSSDDSSPENSFARLVNSLGTAGSYNEKPLGVLSNNLLTLDSMNFFTPSSFTNVIIVSDEADQSEIDTTLLLKDLNDITGSQMMVNAFVGGASCSNAKNEAPVIKSIAQVTGGATYEICSDYRTAFEEMLNKVPNIGNVLALPARKIALPLSPLVESITVSYGSQMIPFGYFSSGWVYDDLTNEILFGSEVLLDQTQPEGTKLVITFEVAN